MKFRKKKLEKSGPEISKEAKETCFQKMLSSATTWPRKDAEKRVLKFSKNAF